MGCQCCRMIKSYIHDPSVAADGRKTDSAGSSSLYQPHDLSGSRSPRHGHAKQKEGFHNLGYSKSSDSTLKLEVDNNHVNHSLHSATTTGPPLSAKELLQRQASAPPLPPTEVYIIQPEALGPRWGVQDKGPSLVPVYPRIQEYQHQHTSYDDNQQGHYETRNGWDKGSSVSECVLTDSEGLSVDEGVAGTPEYLPSGDEGSVLSVDIHTSTTSLSSADTRDRLRLEKTPDHSTMESGISVMKSEDEEEDEEEEEREEEEEEEREEKEGEEVQSVTDSMVAEALAAMEAATAGEDFE